VRVAVAEGIGKKVAVVVNIEKMKATAVALLSVERRHFHLLPPDH